ncbi:MAG: molybdopterin-binding/glycosyltransferase family 2 protein [Alphaproteobacteria bacterium]|nr:molybdopterin-binding/glycosyltransferase family 2 protein [Alphaproteobacteria bacterium]
MKFGTVPVVEAVGLILAHSAGGLKKGRKLTTDDVALLAQRGVAQVMSARLEATDVPEDEAARLLSQAVAGAACDVQAPFTGRANIYAAAPGLVLVDEARLAAFNRIHESLTLAALRNFGRVAARAMLATVKIIPFAVPRAALDQALELLKAGPLVRVQPFGAQNVALVITTTPGQKPALVQKSEKAIADRLASLGSSLCAVAVCAHEQAAIAAELRKLKGSGASLILLFGAAAIVDRADVVPAGLVEAGGEVRHLGMPVDPGNLLMLGRLGNLPVVGVPTCARSPKENGFDWVLNRLCAGLEVSPEDVMAMGAGGLLAEISSRPQPRAGQAAVLARPRLAAIVLAAGLSSRMAALGQGNKLLAPLNGQPLIAQTVARIKASGVDEVLVVTGHQAAEVERALAGQAVRFVPNPRFAEGLATSVQAGVAAARGFDGAFICLGDMPLVAPEDMRRMAAAFNVEEGRVLIAPVQGRKLGNPVLWGAEHFDELLALAGDRGARSLLEARRDEIVEIPVEHDGVMLDADTPEALEQIRRQAQD